MKVGEKTCCHQVLIHSEYQHWLQQYCQKIKCQVSRIISPVLYKGGAAGGGEQRRGQEQQPSKNTVINGN